MAKRFFLRGLLLAALSLFLDQLAKWAIILYIPVADRPAIEIAPFFNLALVWNYGISFGWFAEHREPLILTTLALGIVLILLIWLYKNTTPLVAYGLGLVIGGAAGNMLDRLRFGAVIDFLDVHLWDYHWPAFNIADSSIFIGVVLLCASSMLKPQPKTEGSAP